MVHSHFVILRTNTAGLRLFDFFEGYLLHAVDKQMSKAANSADQAPAPLKRKMGEDRTTTLGKGGGKQYPKQFFPQAK